MQKRLYLAGPMTGIPNYNVPQFTRWSKDLRNVGYEVFNPAETSESKEEQSNTDPMERKNSFRKGLSIDLQYICEKADVLFLMNGWENSKGSKAEFYTAVACGIEIIYEASLVA